jgi:hypothetical protein
VSASENELGAAMARVILVEEEALATKRTVAEMMYAEYAAGAVNV